MDNNINWESLGPGSTSTNTSSTDMNRDTAKQACPEMALFTL